jgi:hypothetical protein
MICRCAILSTIRCTRALDEIAYRIETKQSQNSVVRFMRFMEHPDMIAELTKKLNVALDLFKVLCGALSFTGRVLRGVYSLAL